MCIRIQLGRATVKDLHSRLQHAYQRDDVRLVRRLTVLLDLLGHQVPMAVLCERWGLSLACLSLAEGLAAARHGQLGLWSRGWPPTEVDSSAEETLGRTDRGRATRGGF